MDAQFSGGRLHFLKQLFWLSIGVVLTLLLGGIDYLTGYELSFSLFYLAPISLIAWFSGKYSGIAFSFFAAFIWLAADLANKHYYSYVGLYFWNTAIRLGFFIIVALLLSILKSVLENERRLARTDSLTDAMNSRYFLELVQNEVERASRYGRSFSLAYLDCDNFKEVNDRFGHNIGDEVLREVVHGINKQLRSTDFVGRLGGDEFAILFPETDQEAVQAVISRIQGDLLVEMESHNWGVTFSIGVLTCEGGVCTGINLIKQADNLMYSVKRDGKNNVRYIHLPFSASGQA
jgi:diguanylate cyclase (GGDEF)-like protein